jgi:rare lipoprotein A
MNQNRWTCLATLVLTTVIAPLATVHAKTLPAPAVSPVTSVISRSQTIDRVPSKSNAFTSFTSQTASAPIPVVRSGKSQLTNGQAAPTTVITNSTTAQAEVAPIQSAQDSQSSKTDNTQTATSNRPKMIPVPQQAAPIASQTNESHFEGLRERADPPTFEAVSPVFVFDNEQPRQIVATAIAQVDDTVVAPESSIAIPVERPKQSTIPTQSPVTAPSIVKIEQPAATVQPALAKIVATQTGKASWYGNEAGSQTANGEKYNPSGLTAAHRTLPFGTKVRVTSIKTGRSTIVRINDRGPFSGNRIIDVSAGAAELIGIKNDGIGQVRVEILGSQG